MTNLKVGMKVAVGSLSHAEWNVPTAVALESKVGTVERIKPDYDFAMGTRDRTGVLVAFEPPVEGPNGPIHGFWFRPAELKETKSQ